MTFEPVRVLQPETAITMRQMMEGVVLHGTGTKARLDGYTSGGKTGTAHVADGNIKYGDGVYQATFVGYFPANQPQYTCIVVIRSKPHAAVHFGGSLAGPVFREIATKLSTNCVAAVAVWAGRQDLGDFVHGVGAN